MAITTATTIASTGMPTQIFFGISMKAFGSELRDDLAAADDQHVDAADDVQHRRA